MGARGPLPQQKPTLNFASGVPSPSAYLCPGAKAEYRLAVRKLSAQPGYLQQVDKATLEGYAQSYADFARLTKEIREEGEVITAPNGYQQANPKCALRAVAFKQMQAAAAKLGFSPGDRSRVNAKGVRADPPNPLDGF